jgi:hypothetical protein
MLDDVAGNICIACHVIGYRLTLETRAQNMLYDVAGNICQALSRGRALPTTGCMDPEAAAGRAWATAAASAAGAYTRPLFSST